MTQLIDEFQQLLETYPEWLVWTCLAVALVVFAWVLWRIIKFGMAIIVTVLLVGIVGFAAYVILTS